MSEKTESIINNQILAAIPQSEYLRIAPYLEQVSFSSGQVLQELDEPIKEVYFPYQAMISLVSIMSDGSITEIGLVGNEGMVGLPAILGGDSIINRSIVQISGTGVKLPTKILQEEFQRGETLQRLLLLYTQALLTQVAQTAACNSQHNIKQRLARWLLSVQDCVLSNELLLTQEFIAQMLGIRRSGVTVAARMLQQAGIIRYNRGHITIIDQQELEETACECYLLVRKEFQRLLDFRPK